MDLFFKLSLMLKNHKQLCFSKQFLDLSPFCPDLLAFMFKNESGYAFLFSVTGFGVVLYGDHNIIESQ